MVEKLVRRTGLSVFALLVAGGLFVLQSHASAPALIILDAGKVSANKTGGEIPSGWNLKVNVGQPDITVTREDERPAICLKSTKASFALERGVDIDPAQTPYLTWRWMVTKLPSGGDFRHYATDDQAAQVMVAFTDRRVITYLWDTTAPEGTVASASSIPLVHICAIVCRSGSADLNRWLEENRNVAADYQRAFGKPAPHIKGVRLQINSQHTGSTAESCFSEMAFHDAQS